MNSFHRLRFRLSAWHTHEACLGWVTEKYNNRSRFFLLELREMMCEARREVKRGLPPPGMNRECSVAGELDAARLYRFREPPANEAECGRWGVAFRLKGEDGSFPWEFIAAIELQAGVFQEFRGKTHILGAVYTPEPQLFLVALQEAQRLLELLHGSVKGGGQEEDAQRPSVTGILYPHPDTVFAGLVLFNAAAIVVARLRRTSCHGFKPFSREGILPPQWDCRTKLADPAKQNGKAKANLLGREIGYRAAPGRARGCVVKI